MIKPVSLASELFLERRNGHFEREIAEFWQHSNRVFGGYSAALALAAMAEESGRTGLLSCQVQFIGATLAGPIQVSAETMRRGKTVSSLRASVMQENHITTTVQAWLTSEPVSDIIELGHPLFAPEALGCQLVVENSAPATFFDIFDERAIDYPRNRRSFADGSSVVELWIRPAIATTSKMLESQILDLMMLDAHMLEAPIRARADSRISAATLDFSVMWQALEAIRQWRRLRVEYVPGDGMSVCTTACLSDERRRTRVVAQQLGQIRRL